jgi:hypothetical protein
VARHGAAEEARHDALPGLHVTDDLAAVGQANEQAPLVDLRLQGDERRRALGVEKRTLVVDEVEAAVAADARELQFDRVDGGEPQRLDRCDREPDDPRDG